MSGKKRWEQRSQKTVTIGIGGVSRGTGTTFCTMMLAYFAVQVKKEAVAVRERNCSGHLMELCQEEKRMTLKGIDIFGREKCIEAWEAGYQKVILDCGMLMRTNQQVFSEFCSSRKKLVTASLCTWKKRELEEFVEYCQDIPGNEEWIYLVPFAEKNAVKRMERKLHRKMYAVQAEKEWYRMGALNLSLWEEILEGL